MIKATGLADNGTPLLVLGLSRENTRRLHDDKPIQFRVDRIMPSLPPTLLVLIAGDTEQTMLRELRTAMATGELLETASDLDEIERLRKQRADDEATIADLEKRNTQLLSMSSRGSMEIARLRGLLEQRADEVFPSQRWSPPPAVDRSGVADEQKYSADYYQNDTEGLHDGDAEEPAEQRQDDTEDKHDDPFGWVP